MKRAHVENITTGVEFFLTEEHYETFKNIFLFKGWVDVTPDPKPAPVALTDIHQMNKVSLVAEAKALGLQVSTKMTVAKLKDAILDYKASIDTDVDEGNITEI